jgi:hypothetical protein
LPGPPAPAPEQQDLDRGESPSTAAGEFVREEMHHIREGKHGAKNAKQAIAIGLSEARRAGIPLAAGPNACARTKRKAVQETRRAGKKRNPKRARASLKVLEREPHVAASPRALSRHAKVSAARRKKTGGSNTPKAAARRAARTRKRQTAAREGLRG